jgi:putative NADPH-quinone reductase
VARPLVILGSARPNGETRRAIDLVYPQQDIDLITLTEHQIGGYDYDHRNATDDFHDIVKVMLKTSQIVFATPVYWFAMSETLKKFFDRLTDLTETLKADGRALAGKEVRLIATGTEEILPEGFEVPFRRTAEYFAMRYEGCAYLYTGADPTLRTASEAALVKACGG